MHTLGPLRPSAVHQRRSPSCQGSRRLISRNRTTWRTAALPNGVARSASDTTNATSASMGRRAIVSAQETQQAPPQPAPAPAPATPAPAPAPPAAEAPPATVPPSTSTSPPPPPPANQPAPAKAPSPGQAVPAPLNGFTLSDEAAKKMLADEEDKRKLRRRNKGRIRELEEIRAELAEKELILLEKETELLEKDQTVLVLKEELDLERKLRALLTKEKEKAEEEAALALGFCTGGAMLP